MNNKRFDRRDFLRNAGTLGSISLISGLPANAAAFAAIPTTIVEDAVQEQSAEPPQHHIKFAVCGMSHDHIYGMVGAIQRGGGELVAAWGGEEDKIATFAKRLRAAGAIMLAKANLAEYASGNPRSSFGGTFCNPYDTERTPNTSSAGSGSDSYAQLTSVRVKSLP